jgi:hypothetical protein
MKSLTLQTSMRTPLRRLFVSVISAGALTVAQAALLVHQYKFDGDLHDSIGSLDLVNNGGTVYWGYLSFDANQGPTLNAESSLAGNYSIGLQFELAEVSSYRKLIDFKDRTNEEGLYVQNSQLKFYGATERFGSVPANYFMTVVCTRDGSTCSVYQGQSSTPILSFTDSQNLAVATTAEGAAVFQFFRDDTYTQGEASAGRLYEMRIWDGALAPAEIPNAFAPVPEPRECALLAGLGLLTFAACARRLSRPAGSRV